MPDQAHPTATTAPKTGRGIALTVVLLLLLLIAGGALVASWLLGAAMGLGDACSFTPGSIHCASGDINIAVYYVFLALPPGGLLTALTVGTIGAAIAITRGRTGLRWAGVAWAAFGIALVLTVFLGSYSGL